MVVVVVVVVVVAVVVVVVVVAAVVNIPSHAQAKGGIWNSFPNKIRNLENSTKITSCIFDNHNPWFKVPCPKWSFEKQKAPQKTPKTLGKRWWEKSWICLRCLEDVKKLFSLNGSWIVIHHWHKVKKIKQIEEIKGPSFCVTCFLLEARRHCWGHDLLLRPDDDLILCRDKPEFMKFRVNQPPVSPLQKPHYWHSNLSNRRTLNSICRVHFWKQKWVSYPYNHIFFQFDSPTIDDSFFFFTAIHRKHWQHQHHPDSVNKFVGEHLDSIQSISWRRSKTGSPVIWYYIYMYILHIYK